MEVGFHQGDQIFKRRAVLQTACFAYGQDPFQVAADRRTLRPEAEFPVNHRRAKGSFGRVVRRFDAWHAGERPEPLAMLIQFVAHADQLVVAAEDAAQHQAIELIADRSHISLKGSPADFVGLVAPPQREQPPQLPHQVVSQSFDLAG